MPLQSLPVMLHRPLLLRHLKQEGPGKHPPGRSFLTVAIDGDLGEFAWCEIQDLRSDRRVRIHPTNSLGI